MFEDNWEALLEEQDEGVATVLNVSEPLGYAAPLALRALPLCPVSRRKRQERRCANYFARTGGG